MPKPPVIKSVDRAATGRVSPTVAGPGITLPCASNCGPRWFVALVEPRREAEARDRLEGNGFGAFLPLILTEVRHARQVRTVERPMFPTYLFVRLDVADPTWRLAWHTPPVRRIFGATPERPTPVPPGVVERMIRAGFDRPVTEDLGPDLLEAGADIRLTDGPMADHRGICAWDDGTRCRVLISLLGRQVAATVERRLVARQ